MTMQVFLGSINLLSSDTGLHLCFIFDFESAFNSSAHDNALCEQIFCAFQFGIPECNDNCISEEDNIQEMNLLLALGS